MLSGEEIRCEMMSKGKCYDVSHRESEKVAIESWSIQIESVTNSQAAAFDSALAVL